MNKVEFLNDQSVQCFIEWCKLNLDKIEVQLEIKRSKFVPNGLSQKCSGIEKVCDTYLWRSSGLTTGSFEENARILSELSARLYENVQSNNSQGTLDVCREILVWGGNRRWDKGAWPFLNSRVNLCEYIKSAGETFCLEIADLNNLDNILLMNAMLTKVHSLYSRDGLPIYDSRVAAAIATLVEIWRRDSGNENDDLSMLLTFKATDRLRTVKSLFDNARFPGVFDGYDGENSIEWASAKVRLGWLISDILGKTNLFSKFGDLPQRMRAFESALFMIGYNVECLRKEDGSISSRKSKVSHPLLVDNISDWKITCPLSGEGKEISYVDYKGDFFIRWGDSSIKLTDEVLNNILEEFSGQTIYLGASQTSITPGSLGERLVELGFPGQRWASAIAAVFKQEGYLKSEGKRPIKLIFNEFAT